MDPSVSQFFLKNAVENYAAQYEIDHGPRLDAMLAHWGLVEKLKDKRVLDVGGGLGFLGKRLDSSTEYWVIDGAYCLPEQRLSKGRWLCKDIDFDRFAEQLPEGPDDWFNWPVFDTCFILETLEHCQNVYNVLAQAKKLVKEGGDIIISIPHANVTHNYIYPALMVDPNNFAQFLSQMALPVRDYWLWNKGWNAHHFKCENRPYSEKVMLYPKQESKFLHATPVEMVNW
jgi:2-polyprenyl-3-methyl-5-hydroxy-6-metoxy-1,4-benzoquinol methylase